MPRPRSQRSPQAPALIEEEEPQPSAQEAAVPIPQEPSRTSQFIETIIRCMPNTLSREEKLTAIGWKCGCFCCPAGISFGQCISGIWQATKARSKAGDSLVHWGINASKFFFEAGEEGEPARDMLMRAGFLDILPELLAMSEEVPQSIALTPQASFVQVFGSPKQLPLTSTPQLVLLGLLAHLALAPAALRAVVASPRLLPGMVRSLAASTDDRFRCLALQTLAEWLQAGDGADEGGEQGGTSSSGAGGEGGESFTSVDHAALVHKLLDAGLAAAVVGVMRRSNAAAVLRDAAACLLALLAAGEGGGGKGGGRGHGPSKAHGVPGAAGLTGAELPAGAALEGALRSRARAELLKAGLIPCLLEALSRPSTHWRYWLCVNMGVVGARLLEMQWYLLIIGRICLLPDAPTEAPQQAASAEAASQPASSSGGSGGKRSSAKAGREQAVQGAGSARAQARLEASQQVLSAPALQPVAAAWTAAAASSGGGAAAEGAGAGSQAAAEGEAAAPERALQLLSSAIAAVSRRDVVLPSGTALPLLPAAERNVTPDWRAAQRDRILRAAEEARAAAAQASASSAVDVLSAAMAQL